MFEELLKNYTSIKRMRYFLYQMLLDSDFSGEQKYHRDMRYLHNAALHGSGIVGGLEVAPTADNKNIIVNVGLAINRFGQELVLAEKQSPTSIDGKEGETIYVKLHLDDAPMDPQGSGGQGTETRFWEKTTILANTKEAAPDEVLLATFNLGESRAVPALDQSSPEDRHGAFGVALLEKMYDRLFRPSLLRKSDLKPGFDPVQAGVGSQLDIFGRNFDYGTPKVSFVDDTGKEYPVEEVLDWSDVLISIAVPKAGGPAKYRIKVKTNGGVVISRENDKFEIPDN